MMTEFLLTAPDGGEVCGADCGILPNDPQLTLRSQVVVVPRVSGTTVPAAALHTRADGTAYVVTDAGEVDVTIKGSGQGVAVVEGVPPGTRVQVVSGEAPAASGRPGTEQPTTERTRDPAGESTDGSGR